MIRTSFAPRRVRLLHVALASATFLMAASAGAAPTDADSHEIYERAHEAVGQKNWTEARRLLLQLWERSRTYDVASALGQVEYELGDFVAAAEYLHFASKNTPPREKPETRERFQRALSKVKQRIATVRFVANVEGAEVAVDDRWVGRAPFEEDVFLTPGRHRAVLRLDGKERESAEFEVAAGEERTVALLGNQEIEPYPASAPTGGRGGSSSSAKLPVVISLAAAGAIGVGLGVGFWVDSDGQQQSAARLRDEIRSDGGYCSGAFVDARCEELSGAIANANDTANLGVGFLAAGGALLGAALVTYLIWPEAESAASGGARLTPQFALSPDGKSGSFGLSGAF